MYPNISSGLCFNKNWPHVCKCSAVHGEQVRDVAQVLNRLLVHNLVQIEISCFDKQFVWRSSVEDVAQRELRNSDLLRILRDHRLHKLLKKQFKGRNYGEEGVRAKVTPCTLPEQLRCLFKLRVDGVEP